VERPLVKDKEEDEEAEEEEEEEGGNEEDAEEEDAEEDEEEEEEEGDDAEEVKPSKVAKGILKTSPKAAAQTTKAMQACASKAVMKASASPNVLTKQAMDRLNCKLRARTNKRTSEGGPQLFVQPQPRIGKPTHLPPSHKVL
jgi:hypothetical protein